MSQFKNVPDVTAPNWARRKASVDAQIAAAAKRKRRRERGLLRVRQGGEIAHFTKRIVDQYGRQERKQ